PMPLRPLQTASQALATSLPTGEIQPMPVMTMRRSPRMCDSVIRLPVSVQTEPRTSLACQFLFVNVGLDVVDRLLNAGDLLGFFVGNLALELLFERHDQLHGVERVGTQIVDKGSAGSDFFFLDAQLFDHDFLDAFFDAAHW